MKVFGSSPASVLDVKDSLSVDHRLSETFGTKPGYECVIQPYMAVGGTHAHDARRGIIPDFPVKRTIDDLLAGVDRDLELALELARKNL
jgi:hypothetical protein